MRHLLISREYPPCSYPMGGIGTYVQHIARLLVERGEVVHVIAERWRGAPESVESRVDGRLFVHRVSMTEPLGRETGIADADRDPAILRAMARSPFPAQAFAWQAALVAEQLVVQEEIDVIEAQEYEAPLYYFLVRRGIGAGPARRPPCIVHLHTTREQVAAANDWGLRRGHDLWVKQMEDSTIRRADQLLCPSGFLADRTERALGRDSSSIERVPYPIGEIPILERTADVWSSGTILYVGRLEARKGVFEWIDAAVSVARERRDVRFEIVGPDTLIDGDRGPSVRALLASRVPRDLAPAFAFADGVSRNDLWPRFAAARVAVVPSRWENFPHTCVEALGTGLPVLASPQGGMAEMIRHRATGWIAASSSATDLAAALREALATSPADLAHMGQAASRSIREQCDNDRTIARQLAFRRRVVAAGAGRSLRLADGSAPLAISEVGRAVDVVAASDAVRVSSEFAATAAHAFAANPALGVVTAWHDQGRAVTNVHVTLPPEHPYALAQGEAMAAVAIRGEARAALAWLFGRTSGPPTPGEVATAAVVAGWAGASVPRVLTAGPEDPTPAHMDASFQDELAGRYPEAAAAAAAFAAGLLPPRPPLGFMARVARRVRQLVSRASR